VRELEYNDYEFNPSKASEMINSVKNKVKRDHALTRKNFILENINNIKEFQSKSFLNEDEQRRFKELLGEIDTEREALDEINDIEML